MTSNRDSSKTGLNYFRLFQLRLNTYVDDDYDSFSQAMPMDGI